MEIKRIINGEEIKIALTEQELNAAYREQKRIFDMNEVRDELSNWGLGEILNCCAFPYPSHHYLRDEEIEEAEKALMDKEELMLDIYMEFSRYQEEGHSDYETNMYDACTNVLEMFRDEHWDYLKSYETIDVIAYKKYREDWIKRQNFQIRLWKKSKKTMRCLKRNVIQTVHILSMSIWTTMDSLAHPMYALTNFVMRNIRMWYT